MCASNVISTGLGKKIEITKQEKLERKRQTEKERERKKIRENEYTTR